MVKTKKVWQIAIQDGYLDQCGEDYNKENVDEAGLDYDNLKLLYENKYFWVILNEAEMEGVWVNVVEKQQRKGRYYIKDTIELY